MDRCYGSRRSKAKTSGYGISPRNFGADPNGGTSAVDALNLCIGEANANGTTIDLSAGTWRVDGDLQPLTHAVIDGGGSGELYVDWAPPSGEPILDCTVPVGETYTVTAIAVVTFDFEGAFSADSTVTRLTLSLTGSQVMPVVGDIAKLSSTDALVGVELGDSPGQHAYIAAVSGSFVYVPWAFVDSYTTGMQLVVLKRNPVSLRGLTIRGNYADIVANDRLYIGILVQSAITPRLEDVKFRDLPGNGFMLVGTYMAQTRGCFGARFRNATASEAPAIPGYVGVDAGSWNSVHFGLGGHDVRHVFTTVSPDASSWARAAWGRAFRPKLVGGSASACSAAAYDTHSDAWEPEFHNLTVAGGYYGQNSAGAGIQFRGVNGKAVDCHVSGTAVGYEIYKQFIGERGGHAIEGCTYGGAGTPIRCEHDPSLTGADARQAIRVRDFSAGTTGLIGIDSEDGDWFFEGENRFFHSGSLAGIRTLYCRSATTARGGVLVGDFAAVSGAPEEPRLIAYSGPNNNFAEGLRTRVRAAPVTWLAVIATNTNPDPVLGLTLIECDADKASATASGTYAQFGTGLMPTAGAVAQKLTIAGGRTVSRGTGFALTAWDNGSRITATAALTITVPSAAVLGPEFDCWIFGHGFAVTINGTGATDQTIAAGGMGRIYTRGSAVVLQTSAAAANFDLGT
jgi:hypothetical protein